MDSLEITATHPKSLVVSFHASGELKLTGVSCDEDPKAIYKPLLEWCTRYLKVAPSHTDFSIRLKYFNTSSAKCLLELLNLINQLPPSGKSLSFKWYCEEEDEDMIETVKIFEDLIQSPIEIILIKSY
jgi:hypothetical protein